jgi:acetyl-CoA synthetase
VIVSGHNLGPPYRRCYNEHPAVAESKPVGFSRKGNALYGFVFLKETGEYRNRENLTKEINQQISNQIGPIANDKIQFVTGLPKTRSGKIMRRILRKIAEGDLQLWRHLYFIKS